jgi:hypothetical protein
MTYVAAQLPAPRYSSDAVTPEVIDPRIADVEALARWLDYAFTLPGGFKYGLGGFIGLIPGAGDIVDALLSLYIVGRAVQLGIPRVTIVRMVLNVGIESVCGSLPFAGAIFDTFFKANRRNYQLLRSQLVRSREQSINDWIFVILTAVVVAAGVFLPVFLLIKLLQHL